MKKYLGMRSVWLAYRQVCSDTCLLLKESIILCFGYIWFVPSKKNSKVQLTIDASGTSDISQIMHVFYAKEISVKRQITSEIRNANRDAFLCHIRQKEDLKKDTCFMQRSCIRTFRWDGIRIAQATFSMFMSHTRR